MGGAAEIFQSQEIKKKKHTGINFTKLNSLYFDYYNISISFVHWYILNWKYENCYTELCRVQNFCILASTMTLVLKFLILHTSFIFLWSPLFEPQNDPFLICPPSPTRVFMNTPEKEVM